MSTSQHKKVSKFLSYILRHKPEAIALKLDEHGWANINELISKANDSEDVSKLDRELIEVIVKNNDKQRFIISDDGYSIRANQGHSIEVDLQLEPTIPPEFLYHGTATRFLDSIMQQGLKPQKRQHVHLSKDIETATAVGQRYGKPIILTIKSFIMYEQGFSFYLAKNGVWLTDNINIEFIDRN